MVRNKGKKNLSFRLAACKALACKPGGVALIPLSCYAVNPYSYAFGHAPAKPPGKAFKGPGKRK